MHAIDRSSQRLSNQGVSKTPRRRPWDTQRTVVLRTRLGKDGVPMKRKQLAEKLGVSAASVTYWENGSRTPYAKMRRIIEHIEESLDTVDKHRLKSQPNRS